MKRHRQYVVIGTVRMVVECESQEAARRVAKNAGMEKVSEAIAVGSPTGMAMVVSGISNVYYASPTEVLAREYASEVRA